MVEKITDTEFILELMKLSLKLYESGNITASTHLIEFITRLMILQEVMPCLQK